MNISFYSLYTYICMGLAVHTIPIELQGLIPDRDLYLDDVCGNYETSMNDAYDEMNNDEVLDSMDGTLNLQMNSFKPGNQLQVQFTLL